MRNSSGVSKALLWSAAGAGLLMFVRSRSVRDIEIAGAKSHWLRVDQEALASCSQGILRMRARVSRFAPAMNRNSRTLDMIFRQEAPMSSQYHVTCETATKYK